VWCLCCQWQAIVETQAVDVIVGFTEYMYLKNNQKWWLKVYLLYDGIRCHLQVVKNWVFIHITKKLTVLISSLCCWETTHSLSHHLYPVSSTDKELPTSSDPIIQLYISAQLTDNIYLSLHPQGD